jgi:hypothetical protein
MARTSPHKWTLLHVALAAMLTSYGDEFPSATYRRAAGKLWRCPDCMRVERFVPRRTPRCSGTPQNPHRACKTRPVLINERVAPNDTRHFFK